MSEKSEDPEYEIKRSMLEAAGLDPDSELAKQPFHVIMREIQLIKAGVKTASPPAMPAAPPKGSPAPKKTGDAGERSPAEKTVASPERPSQEYVGERKHRLDEMLGRIRKLSDSLRADEAEAVELAKQLRKEMAPELEEIVSQLEALAKVAGFDEKTTRERRAKMAFLGKEILKKTERYIVKPDESKALSKKTSDRIEALRKSSSSRQSLIEKVLKEQQSIMTEIRQVSEEADR